MEDVSSGELYRISKRISYAVVRLYCFYCEASDPEPVTCIDHMLLACKIVLFKLVLYQSHRQRRSVDRDCYFLEQIRDRSYVVLMSVSDDKSFYLLDILLDVCEIRYHNIDPEHLVLRERQPAVDYEYLVIALYKCAVFAYFLHSPQRDDPERRPDLFPILFYCFCRGFRPSFTFVFISCHNSEAAI